MWDLIQENKTKSVALIVLLAAVLVFLGYAVGFAWDPRHGGALGVLIATIMWVVMMATSLGAGESVLLATAGAREVSREQAPQLHNIVEEMQIASGLPAKPRVFIMDNPAPNAFAVGLKPERAAVAVTTGLLARLNRDELQGVIAHELGHINNRDTLFMTLAGVTVGAVVILADLSMRGLWYGGGRRRSGGKNQGAAIMMIVAIVLAILAPLLAQILYFACSRRREYLADASAALYTRYPDGLASALEKISSMPTGQRDVSRAIAPMYIVNPLAARGRTIGLFSTHPSTEDRIRVLRGMSGDSSLAAYEQAFRQVHKSGVVGAQTLQGSQAIPTRAASADGPADGRAQWRQAKDILHRVNQFGVLTCTCGLRMKMPSEYAGKQITCPRCGTHHLVPPELFAAAAALDAAGR